MRQMVCHDVNVAIFALEYVRACQKKEIVANQQANRNEKNVCVFRLFGECMYMTVCVCLRDAYTHNCLRNFCQRKIKVILATNS